MSETTAPATAPTETPAATTPIGTTVTDPKTGSTFTKVADPAPAELPKPDGNLLTDEVKPAAEAPKEGEKPAEAKPAEKEAIKPESYKLEGDALKDIKTDDPLVATFLAGAAKSGMSNEMVNAVLAEVAPKINEQLAAPHKAWTDMQNAWRAEVQADPVIGGAKLGPAVTAVQQSIERFAGSPEQAAAVKAALNVTGAGNNPAIIRFLHSMATKLSEGTPVMGSPAEQKGQKAATSLYDHPTSRTTT